jgi:hypothetical protein
MSFRNLTKSVVRLCQKVLGEEILYTHFGGESETIAIDGVFSNEWAEVEGIISFRPILRVNLEDLSASPYPGDQVEVRDITYRVAESREDGNGGSTLILKRI